MKNVCAAILAGGLGTRLRPVFADMPKVLAPLGGRPFGALLLESLASAGIERVVFLTGFQAEQVQQAFGGRFGDMTLDYSVETTPMGTAGAQRNALPQLPTETILLLNGDSYCDVDLGTLISQHRYRRADMSLTLAHVPDAIRFGRVESMPGGRLTGFVEKRTSGPGWINAGVYVLEKTMLEKIPDGCAVSLERDLLPAWVQRHRLFGYPHEGRFFDIGTPESYADATKLFLNTSQHLPQFDTCVDALYQARKLDANS